MNGIIGQKKNIMFSPNSSRNLQIKAIEFLSGIPGVIVNDRQFSSVRVILPVVPIGKQQKVS